MIAEKRIQALEKRVDELADRLGRAEDELGIRRLQETCGYPISREPEHAR